MRTRLDHTSRPFQALSTALFAVLHCNIVMILDGVFFADTSLLTMIIFVFVLVHKMSESMVDLLYIYCAITEYVESPSSERPHKVVVTAVYLLLRLISVLMTLVFFPWIREASEKFFVQLVYANAFIFISFYLVSWVSAIRKVAVANATIGNKGKKKKNPGTHTSGMALPNVFVIMPCHREPDESLIGSVNAVLNVDYPSKRLQFFLGFDGFENEDSFQYVVKELGATLTESMTRTAIAVVNGVKITIALFEHGGKPQCQSNALSLVKSCLAGSHANLSEVFLLLVDSDTRLAKNSLRAFAQTTAKRGKGHLPVHAVTCLLGTSDAGRSLIASLEEVDYIHHGLLVEVVAASFGSVFCVSGTQTFVRLSIFLEVCDTYFASQVARSGSLYRYWQRVLGDDRWLTHLLLMHTCGNSLLQLETRVLNETRSAGGFHGLLSQRRRWLLACTSADVVANMSWQMLTQHSRWWTYRILSQTVRMPDIHGFVLGIILINVADRNLNRIGVALFLVFFCNWLLLLWIGPGEGRKAILLYPVFHVCLPAFNMLVRVYTMMTLRKRTWGGSRVGADLK